MDRTEKVTTRVTRRVEVEFTGKQIETLLRKECGFDMHAHVSWDTDDFGVRSVTVVSETVEES